MGNLWARKSIVILEAEAAERDVHVLTTHDGVPLKRTLSTSNLVALARRTPAVDVVAPAGAVSALFLML